MPSFLVIGMDVSVSNNIAFGTQCLHISCTWRLLMRRACVCLWAFARARAYACCECVCYGTTIAADMSASCGTHGKLTYLCYRLPQRRAAAWSWADTIVRRTCCSSPRGSIKYFILLGGSSERFGSRRLRRKTCLCSMTSGRKKSDEIK